MDSNFGYFQKYPKSILVTIMNYQTWVSFLVMSHLSIHTHTHMSTHGTNSPLYVLSDHKETDLCALQLISRDPSRKVSSLVSTVTLPWWVSLVVQGSRVQPYHWGQWKGSSLRRAVSSWVKWREYLLADLRSLNAVIRDNKWVIYIKCHKCCKWWIGKDVRKMDYYAAIQK